MDSFIMAGGGTGGHVIPLLAVADELVRRGRQVVFVGTEHGIESRLVPGRGYRIEYIEIGGLKGVGAVRRLATMRQLPGSVRRVRELMATIEPAGVFSMGGYVAGPVVLAAVFAGVPVVAMEPNAAPGLTNRWMGRFAKRTLLAFPEASAYFPRGSTEVTGLPVREAFFDIPPRVREPELSLLVTGGSRGSRTLNEAGRRSWPLFRKAGFPVRVLHQSGREQHAELAAEFAHVGLKGAVEPFIDDMPAAFAGADLVVCRSGAGALAELAAAGMPSILTPFPFAADQHQLRNAEAFAGAGAARLVLDQDMKGDKLFEIVSTLASESGRLEEMGEAARRLARQGAARRAADILDEAAGITH